MRMLGILIGLAFLAVTTVLAAEPTTVIEGLNNPCGVAIQPGTGDIFVADSGAARIVRISEGKLSEVIIDFPIDVYGKGPKYNIGPLGLAFLNKDTLVVGGGGLKDDKEMLRVYAVPAAGSDPIGADAMVKSFTLKPEGAEKGEGNFYALAVTGNAIYVTSNGDDTKGWVAKADLNGTEVGPFGVEHGIATKEKTNVDAPVGITISPEGLIVVGQMGEISSPYDGLLTFYNTQGEMLMNLETGLSDITAVAYSSKVKGKKRQLYALDFAWSNPSEGGLFQLISVDSETVEPKEIAKLDKPTAMAFAEDGTLYITVIGTAQEGSDAQPGKLLKIAPGL